MIDLRIQYKEGSISAALQNKHYLLEAIVEEKIEARPFHLMLHDTSQMSLPSLRRTCIDLLRTHQPVEIVKFIGTKKYKADWWVANLRLEPTVPTSEKDVSFLLIGWSSAKYQTKAVVVRKGSVKDVGEEMERRYEEKINNGYTKEFELLNVELRTGIIELPEIPGLPKIQEDKRTSFAEILGGVGRVEIVDEEPEEEIFPTEPFVPVTLEPEPEPEPEPEVDPFVPVAAVPPIITPKPLTGWEFVEEEEPLFVDPSITSDPEKIDLMDAAIPHAKAKEIMQGKKEKKETKKKSVLELMRKRRKESDW